MSIESLKFSSFKHSIADSQVKQIPVQYLVIAGGGSGASGGNNFSGSQGTGGGGAGGYLSTVAGEKSGTDTDAGDPHVITLGESYAVDIGAGATHNGGFSGQGSTTFDTIVAVPGGGGGSIGFTNSFTAGGTGASAGGGGNSFSNSRHYPGQGGRPGNVNAGSGGGGAANVEDTSNRNGLPGLASSITGSSVTRAGGGAGSIQNSNTVNTGGTGGGGANGNQYGAGVAGTVNTGSGGGAGGNGNSNNNRGNGGAGGSGVVILRYDKKYTCTVSAGLTAGSETVDGDEKHISITAGTGTVSWG